MKKIILILAAASLVAVSCRKDKAADVVDITQTANDQAQVENEFNSVFETADGVLREDPEFKGVSEVLPLCATVSKDSVTKTLTIDFGNDNCLCKDGLYRRGKIIIHHEGKYRTVGAVITIELDNYYVNDNWVQGTKTITNLGNASGNYKFSFEVKDASITFSDGTVRKWNKSAVVERIEGEGTITPLDDVFLITGNSIGTNRKGRDYNAVTTSPLKKKIQMGCARNFVSGVITITDSEGNTMVINYDPIGGEPCDKIAEVTINGGTPKRITLR